MGRVSDLGYGEVSMELASTTLCVSFVVSAVGDSPGKTSLFVAKEVRKLLL